eukprot:2028415-Rhodomonas_salina.2
MACEHMKGYRERSQTSLGLGHNKEVKRHFDKLALPPQLRRVYCKHLSKQYLSMLTTDGRGVKVIAHWLGHGLDLTIAEQQPSLDSGQWVTFRYGSRTLRIRHSQPCWKDSSFPLSLSSPPDQTPYTLASDRKFQFNYYLAQECTSQRRRCATCHSPEVFSLSYDSGTQREIRWWCKECRRHSVIDFAPTTMDDVFLTSLGIGRFTGRRFLSLPLTDADTEYLCWHLPIGKAAGRDWMQYELIWDAPPFAQQLL